MQRNAERKSRKRKDEEEVDRHSGAGCSGAARFFTVTVEGLSC